MEKNGISLKAQDIFTIMLYFSTTQAHHCLEVNGSCTC